MAKSLKALDALTGVPLGFTAPLWAPVSFKATSNLSLSSGGRPPFFLVGSPIRSVGSLSGLSRASCTALLNADSPEFLRSFMSASLHPASRNNSSSDRPRVSLGTLTPGGGTPSSIASFRFNLISSKSASSPTRCLKDSGIVSSLSVLM